MSKKVFIVTDLAAGDCGKGATVDSLTRKFSIPLVIRFNGACQAAHNVITPDGKHHVFSQFGAGTFAGANTFLSEFVLIEPKSIFNEAKHLVELGINNPFDNLIVDENATIVTPYHALANRIKETFRGKNRHGSCGRGIGETMEDKINGLELKVKDLFDKKKTTFKLSEICLKKELSVKDCRNEYTEALFSKFNNNTFVNTLDKYFNFIDLIKVKDRSYISQCLNDYETLVFEGAQGMLLDEKFGFAPNNTWSNITNENALNLIDDYRGDIIKLGLTRSYGCRHGAGPFLTEDRNLADKFKEEHNGHNEWQQDFRIGHLDLVALRYSINNLKKIDYLVINHCDKIKEKNLVCNSYNNISEQFYNNGNLIFNSKEEQQFGLGIALSKAAPIYEEIDKENLINYISENLKTKIGILGSGQTHNNREYLLDF